MKGFSEEEIRAFKRNNYPKFISYCRRVVPSPKIILSRIDRLVEVFADLQDFSTREKLFKKSTFVEIQNLTKHIVKNCLSDPVGVPMYMMISREGTSFGKSDLPIPKWICLRSTSQLEGMYSKLKLGFHSNVVLATGKQTSSIKQRHINTMEYIDRLNHRQSIRHGLVDPDLSDFYELHLIENINTLRISLGMSTLYPGLCSVFDYADTGERFGFSSTFLNSASDVGLSFEIVDTVSQSNSQSQPIRTTDEVSKFKRELASWLPNPNFDNWAIKWNISVERMRDFQSDMLDISTKTATHLKKFYDTISMKGNRYNSLADSRHQVKDIIGALRKPSKASHPPLYDAKSLARSQSVQGNYFFF